MNLKDTFFPKTDTKASPQKLAPFFNEKTGMYISYVLVLLGAIIYISLTFNNNVWLDEAFTASLVNTDFAGVLSRSMADTLPPLYNIILKISTDIFGYTVPVMKITSTIPMILTMLLGATIVRKRHGSLTACFFIACIIIMPNMMFYGVEIRMYSLGFMFATASGIYLFEVLSEPTRKNFILFTVFSTLAGYSHHFAFITVAFFYLFFLIVAILNHKKKISLDCQITIKHFLLVLLATFILYFPCLITTLKQFKSVSGYFSMPEVTLDVFAKYCRYPYTVGYTPFSLLLLLITFILYIRATIKKQKNLKDYYTLWCIITYYGVLLFGTAISKIMTANIFVDRYLFFALGVLWLFFSIEASKLKLQFVYALFVFQIALGIYSYNEAHAQEYVKGSDELIQYLSNNVSEGDVLYTLEDYEELAYCLPFYDNKLTNYEDLSEAILAASDNTIYCAVLSGYDSEDSSMHPSGNLGYEYYLNEINEAGYILEGVGEFNFDRYEFTLYTLEKN